VLEASSLLRASALLSGCGGEAKCALIAVD
jgi:hypothetical protein